MGKFGPHEKMKTMGKCGPRETRQIIYHSKVIMKVFRKLVTFIKIE